MNQSKNRCPFHRNKPSEWCPICSGYAKLVTVHPCVVCGRGMSKKSSAKTCSPRCRQALHRQTKQSYQDDMWPDTSPHAKGRSGRKIKPTITLDDDRPRTMEAPASQTPPEHQEGGRCEICGSRFESDYGLNNHISVHGHEHVHQYVIPVEWRGSDFSAHLAYPDYKVTKLRCACGAETER